MSRYIRNWVEGGTYFFTVVTYMRRPLFAASMARQCLRQSWKRVLAERPFTDLATVLMPDHIHSVWILPEADCNYSLRWKRIKELFTRAYLAAGGTDRRPAGSGRGDGMRGVWQPRFWEHTCRDEKDLKGCVDYLHWNPVKHGLVQRVMDYPWSTFHRFVRLGEYPPDWGGINPCPTLVLPE